MKHRFSPAIAITAIAVILLAGRAAYSAASFAGQGSVPFDSIKVGKKDSDKILLNGTIQNNRSGKPVRVGDSLEVTGNMLLSGDDSWIKGSCDGCIVGIDDDTYINGTLTVGKDVVFAGTLRSGSTNYSTRIDKNAEVTTHVMGFLDCIGQASQFSAYIESSDFITCFNSWLQGQPKSVP